MFQNVTLWTLFGSRFGAFHASYLRFTDLKTGPKCRDLTNERTHTHPNLGVTHTISPSGKKRYWRRLPQSNGFVDERDVGLDRFIFHNEKIFPQPKRPFLELAP